MSNSLCNMKEEMRVMNARKWNFDISASICDSITHFHVQHVFSRFYTFRVAIFLSRIYNEFNVLLYFFCIFEAWALENDVKL